MNAAAAFNAKARELLAEAGLPDSQADVARILCLKRQQWNAWIKGTVRARPASIDEWIDLWRASGLPPIAIAYFSSGRAEAVTELCIEDREAARKSRVARARVFNTQIDDVVQTLQSLRIPVPVD